MGYGTMIVGTDGSETAGRAVDEAARLAALDDARLVVVTAYEAAETSPDAHAPDDLQWMLTDRVQAEEIARDGRRRASDLGAGEVVVHAVEGSASEVVLDVAEEFGADLIVVGSRGLTSAARFVLGSVAGAVAHHAPCDVLVVHTTA